MKTGKKIFGSIESLLVLALLFVSIFSVTPVNAQESVWAEIQTTGLNVREGPGVTYASLGALSRGDEVEVLGVHLETGWLQIAFEDAPDGTGWISGSDRYVTVRGSLEDVVQIVDVPPSAEKEEEIVDLLTPEVPTGTGLPGKLVFQVASGGDIFIVNADGTGLRKLTTGLDPALSPDGKQVAFARWEGIPRGLFVINTDGTGERLVFGWDKSELKAPTWSSDGQRLAFTHKTGDITQPKFFYRIPEEMKPEGAPEGSGKILVFEGPRYPWWKIASVGENGEDFKELLTHNFSYSPAWAPREADERIVYSSDRGLFITGEEEGMGNVLDDMKRWEITDYQGDRSPAWSPDGHRIAFQTMSHDHWEIVVVNDDGQNRTQITRSWPLADVPVNSVAPTWSPDGQWIAYLTDERGKWELWRMRPDGSEKQPFLEDVLKDIPFQYHSVDERVVSWGK